MTTQGDFDDSISPGIILTNNSKSPCTYHFYDNYWNGNGTAGANFDKPLRSLKVAPGVTAFASLLTTFKGRVQRGTLILAI
ncbi:hypothetical protein LTR66_008119 [Elasticomyces elasticus]|nr:hypothetical protein LTR66_008119 [Elasticomyces elasticus]